MKERHATAAKAIFTQRNSAAHLLKGRLDLHGLHITESLDCLRALLPAIRDLGVTSVNIITGTGHHSHATAAGGAVGGDDADQRVSRLLLAVQSLVQDELCLSRTKAVRDPKGYIGALQVFF
jgi:hypothetical protein